MAEYCFKNTLVGVAIPAPSAPLNLVATAGESQINLDWDDNPEADIAGYNVYRATSPGGPYTKLNSSLVSSSSYVDSSAVVGITYYYVVRAVNTGAVSSGDSNEDDAVLSAPASCIGSGLSTDIERGNALKTAVTSASPGDTITLCPGTFDLGSAALQLNVPGLTIQASEPVRQNGVAIQTINPEHRSENAVASTEIIASSHDVNVEFITVTAENVTLNQLGVRGRGVGILQNRAIYVRNTADNFQFLNGIGTDVWHTGLGYLIVNQEGSGGPGTGQQDLFVNNSIFARNRHGIATDGNSNKSIQGARVHNSTFLNHEDDEVDNHNGSEFAEFVNNFCESGSVSSDGTVGIICQGTENLTVTGNKIQTRDPIGDGIDFAIRIQFISGGAENGITGVVATGNRFATAGPSGHMRYGLWIDGLQGSVPTLPVSVLVDDNEFQQEWWRPDVAYDSGKEVVFNDQTYTSNASVADGEAFPDVNAKWDLTNATPTAGTPSFDRSWHYDDPTSEQDTYSTTPTVPDMDKFRGGWGSGVSIDAGDVVSNDGAPAHRWEAQNSGTTGGSAPTAPDTVHNDGGVTWNRLT